MTEKNIGSFIALDFEASSLSSASWPIEVGLSWIREDRIETWSTLIRPDPDWDQSDWSAQSEAVHGIPLSALLEAPAAIDVADKFLCMAKDFILVSDAPEFENRWLTRLLAAGGHQASPIIEDFHAVSFAVYDGIALDLLYEKLERTRAPHRAGPDSARLAAGWLTGQQASARTSTEGTT